VPGHKSNHLAEHTDLGLRKTQARGDETRAFYLARTIVVRTPVCTTLFAHKKVRSPSSQFFGLDLRRYAHCMMMDDRVLEVTKRRSGAPEGNSASDHEQLHFCVVPGQNLCHYNHHHPSKPQSEGVQTDAEIFPVSLNVNINPDVDVIPAARVRFRSRVRITSGLHRYHTPNDSALSALVPGEASLSSSLSSSISAPLHTPGDDEENERPGWGPLGQRVSLFACRGRGLLRAGSSVGPTCLA